MIIAGEASGDLHAAKLVREVQEKTADVQFYGIGGEQMRKAGVETLVDSAQLAVVGLVEVLAHWSTISGALKKMQRLLRTDPPDLLILTDYPDFNLRLAKTAKECGVKVLYYISPQVWAWRQKRVYKIRDRVDMMAVVFPFEEDFYRKYNVPVRFVGHPLTDEVHASADTQTLRKEFLLDSDRPVVGLFPGSRHSEIRRLLPIIVAAAKLIADKEPQSQFIVPVASTLSENDILPYFEDTELDLRIISDRSYDVMQACDAIITVSGTVTLEIALLHKPMVVINRISRLSYFLVSRMLKIPYIALCNIVANRKIVPELIQDDATPEKIATTLLALLQDSAEMKNELSAIHDLLTDEERKTDLSKLVISMLD